VRREKVVQNIEYLEGNGEAVAVVVHCNSPFESGTISRRFDVVGECAGILKNRLQMQIRKSEI
jgi:hypothetical protein